MLKNIFNVGESGTDLEEVEKLLKRQKQKDIESHNSY